MAAPYLSEIKYLGAGNLDFVEISVDAGIDVSGIQVVIYNSAGTIRSTDTLGTSVNTVAGTDVYIVDKATGLNFSGLHKLGAVALVVDGTVVAFSSFSGTLTATEGPAIGLTSTFIGSTGGGESLESTDGTTYAVQTAPNPGTVPCFVEGTLILTQAGYRPIEALQIGDKIITRSNGTQALRWVGSRLIEKNAIINASFRPIIIPANAIAPGIPATDLLLSPNHRVLVKHAYCNLLFGQTEVLVPAKSLVGMNGIARLGASFGFRYFHLLFDQHEIITSNGMATESFHPAHVGLEAFTDEIRTEILSLFPELRMGSGIYGSTARMALKSYEANILHSAVFQPTATNRPRFAL